MWKESWWTSKAGGSPPPLGDIQGNASKSRHRWRHCKNGSKRDSTTDSTNGSKGDNKRRKQDRQQGNETRTPARPAARETTRAETRTETRAATVSGDGWHCAGCLSFWWVAVRRAHRLSLYGSVVLLSLFFLFSPLYPFITFITLYIIII